jgi:hypothetical protein
MTTSCTKVGDASPHVRRIVWTCFIAGTIAVNAGLSAAATPPVQEKNAPMKHVAPKVVASEIFPNDGTAVTYWTLEKMKNAELSPGGGGVPTHPPLLEGADSHGYVVMDVPYTAHDLSRVNGMLFYVQPENGAVSHCSASLITSGSKSLVLTAAHCVHTEMAGWKEKIIFVPAYNGELQGQQRTPLGKWTVGQAFIPFEGADVSIDADVAVLRIYPGSIQSGAPVLPIESAIGAALSPQTNDSGAYQSLTIVGYPGIHSGDEGITYVGQQRRCVTPAVPDPNSSGLKLTNCFIASGNSGGPLVITNSMHVVGVVHKQFEHARLKPSFFNPVYEAADGASAK